MQRGRKYTRTHDHMDIFSNSLGYQRTNNLEALRTSFCSIYDAEMQASNCNNMTLKNKK